MFAPKRRHGRRPKANTREGGNPRFDGFVVPPNLHNISQAAPPPTSTTVLMTALTDTKKQNKPYQEKTPPSTNHVQSGERGRGDKEGVLRVKPKGFTRR